MNYPHKFYKALLLTSNRFSPCWQCGRCAWRLVMFSGSRCSLRRIFWWSTEAMFSSTWIRRSQGGHHQSSGGFYPIPLIILLQSLGKSLFLCRSWQWLSLSSEAASQVWLTFTASCLECRYRCHSSILTTSWCSSEWRDLVILLFHTIMHDCVLMVSACGCSRRLTLWRQTTFAAWWDLLVSCLLRPQMVFCRLYVSAVHIMSPCTRSRKCVHMIFLTWTWVILSRFFSFIVTVYCQNSRLKWLRVSARSFSSSSKLSNKSRSSRMQLWVKLMHPRCFNSVGRQRKVAFHCFKSSVVVWRLPFPTLQPSNWTFPSLAGRNMTAEWSLMTSILKEYCTRNSSADCRSCHVIFWKRTRRVMIEPRKFCK